MNEKDAKLFNEMYSKFESKDYSEALQGLRDLAKRIDDPWDLGELAYHETMFLIEMHRVDDARQRLEDLKKAVALLFKTPSDGYEFDLRVSLPVMARYAELMVTIEEGREPEALLLIEDIVSRYPKQLSLPEFRAMAEEITTLRGFLLADAGRWAAARPFLEQASPPKAWSSRLSYYLGHCHYEFHEYDRARHRLVEALTLGLEYPWEGKAHYILGLVEYHLSDMKAAKQQFELSAKTADPTYLGDAIWEWLETTSRALGLQSEAENYGKMKADSLPKTKTN
jgi:tetratricopeptide (TPR) repeat protein